MKKTKSPFFVIQDFLSSKEVDAVIAKTKIPLEIDENNMKLPNTRIVKEVSQEIYEKLKPYLPKIEQHYDLKVRGVEHIVSQQFPISSGAAEDPHCESHVYKRKKWIKVKDRDLSGIIWLKDYQDSMPFDLDKHVYGGKLEFKTFDFSFQPQRGTLVLYPAGPHFISATSRILVGELNALRVNVAAEGIWLYQPDNFPGTFKDWFNEVV